MKQSSGIRSVSLSTCETSGDSVIAYVFCSGLCVTYSDYSRSSDNVVSLQCWWGKKTKKQHSWPGPPSMWSLHILPMSVWLFSWDPGFFPHPKDVHVRCRGMATWSRSAWMWTCVSVALRCKGVLSRVGVCLPCGLSCQDRLPPLRTMNWNKRWETIIHFTCFLFIF